MGKMGETYEDFDPYFSSKRIVFNALEFMELLPIVPHMGWVLFDEAGIDIGHRTWLSETNQAINFVTQSFRYRMVNVIFTIPSKYYLDKVPREMCHFLITMQRRGHGRAYRIKKKQFYDDEYTPKICDIMLKLPRKRLCDEYERMRKEHQDNVYKELTDKLRLSRKKAEERRQKALHPQDTFGQLVEKARLILP